MNSRHIFLLFSVVLLFGLTVPAHADSVATVQFTGVSSNCAFQVGPCNYNIQEVWSGSFSVDLLTGEILSDSISGVGPGSGPWLGGEVGTFVSSDCLPSTPFPGVGCSINWYDAQGWSLQWDPGNYTSGILDSVNHGAIFFGMDEFLSVADTYSVTVPELPSVLLLLSGFLVILTWRSLNRAYQGPIA